jgi:N-acetylglucosaminyl-diphospho-decaprenol L-rhamnosyltransferase
VISTIAMGALPTPPAVAEPPDVSVVVVNYNTAHLFGELFAGLDASRGALKLQVIVVDNASRDGSVDILRTKYPNVG